MILHCYLIDLKCYNLYLETREKLLAHIAVLIRLNCGGCIALAFLNLLPSFPCRSERDVCFTVQTSCQTEAVLTIINIKTNSYNTSVKFTLFTIIYYYLPKYSVIQGTQQKR